MLNKHNLERNIFKKEYLQIQKLNQENFNDILWLKKIIREKKILEHNDLKIENVKEIKFLNIYFVQQLFE
jgi:hypothetical protein